MADSQLVHNHYWPGESLVTITPQARRFGYVFPVFVTRSVWHISISWKQGKNTNPEKRIHELLDSCWKGMGKALSSEPDRVMYPFKHWYWSRVRPNAKTKQQATLGARLLLDPETEEPWLLIFDPLVDDMGVLEYGEPAEHRANESGAGEQRPAERAEVDSGAPAEEHAPERRAEGSSDELEQSPTGD